MRGFLHMFLANMLLFCGLLQLGLLLRNSKKLCSTKYLGIPGRRGQTCNLRHLLPESLPALWQVPRTFGANKMYLFCWIDSEKTISFIRHTRMAFSGFETTFSYHSASGWVAWQAQLSLKPRSLKRSTSWRLWLGEQNRSGHLSWVVWLHVAVLIYDFMTLHQFGFSVLEVNNGDSQNLADATTRISLLKAFGHTVIIWICESMYFPCIYGISLEKHMKETHFLHGNKR